MEQNTTNGVPNGTVKYSVDVGNKMSDITQGAGVATTAGLECTIDLAKFTRKDQIYLALDALRDYIQSSDFPG